MMVSSLSNVLSVLEDTSETIEELILRNSFHTSMRPTDRALSSFAPRAFANLKYLEVSSTAGLVIECLLRVQWTSQAEVHVSATLDPDPALARQEAKKIFDAIRM